MTTTADAATIEMLERRFWDSLVMQDTQVALDLLTEPAVMISAHGALSFGHEQYRKMADEGPVVLKSYEFSDVNVTFPDETLAIITYRVRQETASRDGGAATSQLMNDSSTWLREGRTWKCVMHTETPAAIVSH